MRIRELVSAGGVVYRVGNGAVEVVICGRIGPGTWNLPKGRPNEGESIEDTALREVEEETGLQVSVQDSLGSIEYKFEDFSTGVHYHKEVHHYLMTKVGGSLAFHDEEFDQVIWIPIGEAVKLMTYENDVDVLKRAIIKLS